MYNDPDSQLDCKMKNGLFQVHGNPSKRSKRFETFSYQDYGVLLRLSVTGQHSHCEYNYNLGRGNPVRSARREY